MRVPFVLMEVYMIEIRAIEPVDERKHTVWLDELKTLSAAVVSDALDVVRGRLKKQAEETESVVLQRLIGSKRGGVLPSSIQSLGECEQTLVGSVTTVWHRMVPVCPYIWLY